MEKEELVECDTVLFSVGLMPENELTRKAGITMDPITNGPKVDQYMQTSQSGVFACGNVVHVNDLVDNVSGESATAGKYAAKYALASFPEAGKKVSCVTGRNVRYLCPQSLEATQGEAVNVFFRVLQPEENVRLVAKCGDTVLYSKKEFRVNPGEMNHVTIDPVQLSGDLTVLVEKEG